MRIDLFENKYKASTAMKVFFFDIVCFLLVAIVSVGFCYSYFSDKVDVKGSTTTAHVAVQYQYSVGGVYKSVSDVYGKVNNGTEQVLKNLIITPGDSILITGRAVNISNVQVYVLAKLEIVIQRGNETITKTIWYNIGSNDPEIVKGEQVGTDTPNALAKEDYLTLYQDENTKIHQVGAGSLGAFKHKELAIPYPFEGDEYFNGDVIQSITLDMLVHQKEHLRGASDFENYSQYEDVNGQINGYDTESIYAVHQMTGTVLED